MSSPLCEPWWCSCWKWRTSVKTPKSPTKGMAAYEIFFHLSVSAARTDPGKAARVAYVIGTFAGHPAVMGSMNAFLQWLAPQLENPTEYVAMHENIDKFIAKANATFKKEGYPLELSNWFSVWSMMYTQPGRYHWMLQYYMRDAGVNLSWVGTGRLLFSLDWTQAHYDDLLTRMLAACKSMKEGGWWEKPRVNVKRAVGIEFVTAIVKMLVKMPFGL